MHYLSMFTEEVSLSFRHAPPPLRNIHTHPTSLTAICPVINLTDTLCNIDCLIALHQIAACLFLHVCVCVCVCACAFVHLSFILLASAPTCVRFSGSDANECICPRCVTLCPGSLLWCNLMQGGKECAAWSLRALQLYPTPFIYIHLPFRAGRASSEVGGGLQIEYDNNYWEREWEADSDVWLRATKVWSCNIGFYLTVAHWCFILSEGGNASSLYPALF